MRLRRQLIGSGRGGIGPCALPRDESANLQTQLPSKPRGEGPGAVHRAQKLSSKLQIPSLPAYSRKGTEMRRFCSCRRG